MGQLLSGCKDCKCSEEKKQSALDISPHAILWIDDSPTSDDDGLSTTCFREGVAGNGEWEIRDAQLNERHPSKVIDIACSNYDMFHSLRPGTTTKKMLTRSSAGIKGWAAATFNSSIARDPSVNDNETVSSEWSLVEKDKEIPKA
jgi:hypothetical protein